MATISKLTAIACIYAIRFYRMFMSSLVGSCCRFEPSCSAYAIEAIKAYGCLRGCQLMMRRVLRCHPWHPGGIDPIP